MMRTEGGGLSLKGILYLYDRNGSILWTTETPENMDIENASISDNGEIIAFTQVYVEGDYNPGVPFEKVITLNKSGQELFSFPHDSREYRIYADPVLDMSGNGRYISVRAKNNKKLVRVYIDSKNRSYWAAPYEYRAKEISNEGIAILSLSGLKETDPKTIDLKKYLGDQ
jgi:hypothetical protein